MAEDTTQFIVDLHRTRKKQAEFSDLEGATPLVKNEVGEWIDAPTGTGDLIDATPITPDAEYGDKEPSLIPKVAGEIPEPPQPLTDYIAKKYERGKAPFIKAGYASAFARGEITLDEMLEKGNADYLNHLESIGKLEDVTFWDEPIKKALGAAAELVPFAMDSAIEAAKHAVVFGSATAIAGVLVAPPVGIPTIPLTFTTGAVVGGTYGVVKNSLDVEGMNLFFDLLEKGVPRETALPIAIAGGIAIGVTEVYQLRLFGAGFKRKVVEAIISKLGKKALLNMAAIYTKNLGIQVAQELVQESIDLSAKYLASVVENNPNVLPTRGEMVNNLTNILTEGTLGMAVLGIPSGVAVGVRTKAINAKEAMAQVEKVIAEKAAKVAEEKVTVEVTPEEAEISKEKPPVEKKPSEKVEKAEPAITQETKVNKDGKLKVEVEAEKKLVSETKTRVEIKRKDIQGRINKLESEIKTQNEVIEAISKAFIAERSMKNIERFHGQMVKAYEKLSVIQEKLIAVQLLQDATEVDLGAVKVELKANEVRALQAAVVKEKALALERGIKKGKKIQRDEILAIQNEITALVIASEATEAGKRNALKAMRLIQTEAQFEKALPKMIALLDKSAERFKKSLLINKFKKLTKAKAVHELRPEIKKEVDFILESVTAVKPSKIKVAKIMKALKENEGNELTDEQLLHLAGLDKKPLSDMSLEDVQFIHDAVSHLIWLNADINKAIEQERTAQDQRNVAEAVSNLGRKYKNLEGSLEGLDSLQKEEERKLLGVSLGGVGDIVGVGSYNMELIGEILDGQENGIIQRIMYREIDKGEAKSLKYKHDAEDYFIRNGLREILKDDSFSEFFTKKVKEKDKVKFTLESGETITITKGTRIAFLLHARNEDSRRHLLEGGFVLRRHVFAKVKKMTGNDLDRIIELASKEEKRVADLIHGYFNTIQKQAINETSVGLLGFEVAVIENYFPIQVSGQALTKEERIKTLTDENNFIKQTLEGMGIFKRRVKSNAPLVITDAFEVTHENIQKVSAYIGLAAPLRRAKALLHAPDFKAALENAGLGKYRQSIEDYLGRVEGDSIRNDAFDKLTQNWINRLDVAILGGNVGVFFKQPVSYFLAATELDMKYIATSFRPTVSKSLRAEIMKWNPHFRDRFEGNVTRELGEVASVGRTRRFFTGRELMSNKFMIGIKTFDTMAIAGIWRATRKEIADKNPNLKVGSEEFMQKVSERAWEVARRTQPTFAIKDRSTIGRKQSTFWRLATKYSSQRNKNWMIQRRAIEQWNRSEKTFADNMKVLKRVVLIRLIAPAMIAGVNAVRGLGRDDVDDEEKTLLKRFVSDWIAVTIGDIYIISNILQGAITQIAEGRKGFGMTDPLTANWARMSQLIADVVKGVSLTVTMGNAKNRRKAEKQRDATLWRVAKETSDIVSKVKGIPFESARKSLELGGKTIGIIPKKEDMKKFTRHRF